MTKAELIAQVAEETGLTKAASKGAVETVVGNIIKTLKKEGRFAYYGLGVFEVVKRKKRKGRNPRTNEPVIIKAHKAVRFKAAKSLKEAVNNEKGAKK
ncbi:MAG: HU family DNA-binding protein [Candidatus Adiutrix sp.]|jgi:DNA-binding protein HU-beta|nr:HU family DNA-binding protein [Candidatus Adiutrix sp.]